MFPKDTNSSTIIEPYLNVCNYSINNEICQKITVLTAIFQALHQSNV